MLPQSRGHSIANNGPLLDSYTGDDAFNLNYGLNSSTSNKSMNWNTDINDEDCANLLQWLLDEPAAQTAIPNLLGDPFDLDIQL